MHNNIILMTHYHSRHDDIYTNSIMLIMIIIDRMHVLATINWEVVT